MHKAVQFGLYTTLWIVVSPKTNIQLLAKPRPAVDPCGLRDAASQRQVTPVSAAVVLWSPGM